MSRTKEFDINKTLYETMLLFWEKGYSNTSLALIMKATKLNKQSIYDTFGDKYEFFLKALQMYRERTLNSVEAAIKKDLQSGNSTLAILAKMISPLGQQEGFPKGCLIINTSLEFNKEDIHVFQEVNKMFEGFEEHLSYVVQIGQERGEITKKFSLEEITKILVNAFKGLKVAERMGDSVCSIEQVVNITIDMIRL